MNGGAVPAVAGCTDVDLAFTPATNPLRQRYRRTSQSTYDYAAPDLPFAGILTVNPEGFVLDYAGLWRADLRSAQ